MIKPDHKNTTSTRNRQYSASCLLLGLEAITVLCIILQQLLLTDVPESARNN